MIAYKFLATGAIGPFSGFAWPTGAPGSWVEGDAQACVAGVHGCAVDDLPYWLQDELWEVELEGAQRAEHKLVAPRGRLLRWIAAWDGAARTAFALDRARRAAELAETVPEGSVIRTYAADAATYAAAGRPATAAFVCARVAELVDGMPGYESERRRQASWLADWLRLEVPSA